MGELMWGWFDNCVGVSVICVLYLLCFYCLYCVFILLLLCMFRLIIFICTTIRTTATKWNLNCSNNNNNNNNNNNIFYVRSVQHRQKHNAQYYIVSRYSKCVVEFATNWDSMIYDIYMCSFNICINFRLCDI